MHNSAGRESTDCTAVQNVGRVVCQESDCRVWNTWRYVFTGVCVCVRERESKTKRGLSCVYGCLCVLMKRPLENQLPEPIQLSPNQPWAPGACPRQTQLAPTRSRAGWESNCTAVQHVGRVVGWKSDYSAWSTQCWERAQHSLRL